MLYNADETVGTQCTNFQEIITSSTGTQEVVWNSVTQIEYVESTNNIPKGYSFVGLTENLEVQVSDIESIPATYEWTRTNTTIFKGNVCFDFMTSDTKGDSTSTVAEEHMLWLEYEGDQLPIGWTSGIFATIDNLYGTSWSLYSGENTDTSITVRSLLPNTQFEGSFTGDIKDWLDALVSVGAFTDATYVNVGNAGTEMFYGDSIMNATLGLQINLGTDTTIWTDTSASAITSISEVAVISTSTSTPSSTTAPTTSTSSSVIMNPASTSIVPAPSSKTVTPTIAPTTEATITSSPNILASTLATASTAVNSSLSDHDSRNGNHEHHSHEQLDVCQ